MNVPMRNFRRWMIVTLHVAAVTGSAFAAQINTSGRLEISADDGSFSARVTGRLFMDTNFYMGGDDNKQLTSGSFARSARIGLEGNFHEYEYAVESDFADETSQLKDGYLRRILGPGKIMAGQFKVLEGLEQKTSGEDDTFMENSYLSQIIPGHQIGAAYYGATGMFGYAGTVYNMRQAADGEARPITSGLGSVVRGFVAPINQNQVAVHLGASFAHEFADIDNPDFITNPVRVSPAGRAERYRNGSNTYRFVIYDRDGERASIDRLNLETLMINGPLSLQGEYLKGVSKVTTQTDDDFNAWYAQLSYFITGEVREYKILSGDVNRPIPNRDTGAVEIAARYQQVEREKIAGAKLRSTDLGLTYYANQNVRILVNYNFVHNNLSPGDPNLLSTRFQFDF